MRSFNSKEEFYEWQTKQEIEGVLAMLEGFVYTTKMYTPIVK